MNIKTLNKTPIKRETWDLNAPAIKGSELCTFNASECKSIHIQPPLYSPFFATGSHIDSMHEPAELSQNKLHRLEFDNPFMRSSTLISGWWLCLAPLQGRGEAAHWRDTAAAYSNCFIALLYSGGSLCSAVSES